MRSISVLIILLIIGISTVFGQGLSDTISMKRVSGDYDFYKGDQRLNMIELVTTLKTNKQATKLITSAQSSFTIGQIFRYAGGAMVGYQYGLSIGGGKPNWVIAGIGAGLAIISIPISQGFNKKAKKAIEAYNAGLQTSSFWYKNELKISMTGNGFGLSLRF